MFPTSVYDVVDGKIWIHSTSLLQTTIPIFILCKRIDYNSENIFQFYKIHFEVDKAINGIYILTYVNIKYYNKPLWRSNNID